MQGCNLSIAAGSMTIGSGPDGYGADFTVTGPGGAATGRWILIFGPSFRNATQINSGDPLNISWGEDIEGGFSMAASVAGFSLTTGRGMGIGNSGFGSFEGGSFRPITGAGTYKGTLDLTADVICPNDCGKISIAGTGVATLNVVPTNLPGVFALSNATVTFVPEPSTASLLLIAFAGLAVLGWRRGARATLLQS